MVESVAYYAGGCFADMGSPEFSILFVSSANQQQAFENFGCDGDEEGSLAGLLSQMLVITTSAVALFFLFKARNLLIEELKSCDCEFLLLCGGERR